MLFLFFIYNQMFYSQRIQLSGEQSLEDSIGSPVPVFLAEFSMRQFEKIAWKLLGRNSIWNFFYFLCKTSQQLSNFYKHLHSCDPVNEKENFLLFPYNFSLFRK